MRVEWPTRLTPKVRALRQPDQAKVSSSLFSLFAPVHFLQNRFVSPMERLREIVILDFNGFLFELRISDQLRKFDFKGDAIQRQSQILANQRRIKHRIR